MNNKDQKTRKLSFKTHVPNLLKEITDNAIGASKGMGVLFVPMNQFRIHLVHLAQCAAEINNPELNLIMCQMTLYDQVDPQSANYQEGLFEEVQKQAKIYREQKKSEEAAGDKKPSFREEVLSAFAGYVTSEGCSCCADEKKHAKYENKLGELLDAEKCEDGSGFDWFKIVREDENGKK